MRLKSLWIGGFKNLNDFQIDFEDRDGITVLIGNNASGKSNILEAISFIFSDFYQFKSNSNRVFRFWFDIAYSINGYEIYVSHNLGGFTFKVKKEIGSHYFKEIPSKEFYQTIGRGSDVTTYKYIPSQVIALYSGEELRLWEKCYSKSYVDFFNNLQDKQYITSPKMSYINKYSWSIGLIALFCSEKSSVKRFIEENYGTDISDGIDVSFSIDEKKYKYFEDNNALLLIKRIKGLSDDNNGKINTNTLRTLDIVNQQITTKEIFEYLYIVSSPVTSGNLGVKITRIVDDIKIKQIDVEGLSEGQKKQILLKLALEVLADENSLLLFDEPDAHIHIANKKLIPEMLKEYEGNREIILTTHSPTLAHSFDGKHLAYVENGKINEDYNTQEKLLNELTNGLMGVSEQQLLLQSNKDILIVEGKTDDAYISQALKVLKESEPKYQDLDFNFLWLGGSDADTFNKIINEFNPKENQIIIAFFDGDDAGRRCIKKILGISTEKKVFKGGEKEGIHIHLYPKKDDFNEANYEVEDYFPIEVLRDFVITQDSKNFQSVKNKFDKNKFVKKCKGDDFDKSNFDGFKTLFNKILEIKNK